MRLTYTVGMVKGDVIEVSNNSIPNIETPLNWFFTEVPAFIDPVEIYMQL